MNVEVDRLARAGSLGEMVYQQQRACAQSLDATLAKARAGTSVHREDLNHAAEAFTAYYAALSERNGTDSNLEFAPEDQASMYIEAIKLTALGHCSHTAWPFISAIRGMVLPTLRERLAKGSDAWTHFAAIIPAIQDGDLELALRAYNACASDPLCARLGIAWVETLIQSYPGRNNVVSAHRFLSAVTRPEPAPSEALSDQERFAIYACFSPSFSLDPRTTLSP